jgi:hypothetical protein
VAEVHRNRTYPGHYAYPTHGFEDRDVQVADAYTLAWNAVFKWGRRPPLRLRQRIAMFAFSHSIQIGRICT